MRLVLRDAEGKERAHSQDASKSWSNYDLLNNVFPTIQLAENGQAVSNSKEKNESAD